MYDIEVNDIHEYNTMGFIVHNSGKDFTKVDRSGAYMARYIAKNIVAGGLAKSCEVQLSFAIGKPNPVSMNINTFGTQNYSLGLIYKAVRNVFDLSIKGFLSALLGKVTDYAQLSKFGHFGEFNNEEINRSWELTDKADELRSFCENNKR